MTVKDVIHAWCLKKGYTLKDVADIVGTTPSNLRSRLARNDGQALTAETLIKWIDLLDMQLLVLNGQDEYILDGYDEEIPIKED